MNPYSQTLLSVAQDLVRRIGFEAEVRVAPAAGSETVHVVSVESVQDLSMLIGKNGQNLQALEHLVRLVVARKLTPEERGQFVLDINDYRKSRAQAIIETVHTAAHRVIQTKRAEALAPMSPYERRLVHTHLASFKEVQTESIGEEPRRRVVIKPLAFE